MSARFAAACVTGPPESLAGQAVAALAPVEGATLGILYVSEPAAQSLAGMAQVLAAQTGIGTWVGGVGLGVLGMGAEIHDAPAAAIMVAALPPDGFRVFAASADPGSDLPRLHSGWIEATQPPLALVHADPRCPDVARAAQDLAAASGAFLVGGLVSHRCAAPLLARSAEKSGIDEPDGDDTATGKGGLAGLMLAPGIPVATALSQGCSPIGPVRRIDEARDNVVMTIEGKPALAAFTADIGPTLARDLRRVGGLIFAGLPLAGSDTGDYLVRDLVAIDPECGWLVLGAEVAAGDAIVFCRRDPESARRDLVRMLRQLGGRVGKTPQAGIYVSCIARGASLFGEAGIETALIRETLGEFPLVGFFANGEISRDRIYGHTGVLTLFT